MELKHVNIFLLLSGYLLLIVPYGIETPEQAVHDISEFPFNRTLWN